jgi:hypothetical protein
MSAPGEERDPQGRGVEEAVWIAAAKIHQHFCVSNACRGNKVMCSEYETYMNHALAARSAPAATPQDKYCPGHGREDCPDYHAAPPSDLGRQAAHPFTGDPLSVCETCGKRSHAPDRASRVDPREEILACLADALLHLTDQESDTLEDMKAAAAAARDQLEMAQTAAEEMRAPASEKRSDEAIRGGGTPASQGERETAMAIVAEHGSTDCQCEYGPDGWSPDGPCATCLALIAAIEAALQRAPRPGERT